MSIVKSLSVSGYKSIKELKNFELRNLNVLIGANGAGKSNFISLFRLLNEIYEQQLELYVQKQGGPDALLHFGRGVTERLHAEFYFGPNSYEFDLIPSVDNLLIFEREYAGFSGDRGNFGIPFMKGNRESGLKNSKEKIALFTSRGINNWRVYHFHDTSETAKVKQRHASNDNLQLKNDAANLAAYLRMLYEKYPSEYQRIVETIRLVLPFFHDFVYRQGTQDYVELEWFQTGKLDTPFKAHRLSDGSLRFICLMTLLLQPISLLPQTILIDEPELGLHPYAISVFADVCKQVAERRQLIISTQSVELVNELSPEDVIVVDQENDASTFRRYTEAELAGWLEEYAMGELWKRNILGGRP
ncbi:MAG: AAA family ATPase [Thiotrichaceae bacterium]|nr:AAA family ATPase [Thiotrichaceae bacterium]